jgi:hypothetical protein
MNHSFVLAVFFLLRGEDMRFGQLDIDPAVNPAVLDTVTWDPERVRQIVHSVEPAYWSAVREALLRERPLPCHESCTVHRGSCAGRGQTVSFLAGLADGQYVFVEITVPHNSGRLGTPIQARALGDDLRLAVYAADGATIRQYVRAVRPDKAPRALGAVPRLGIGTRMSTSVWPGIWRAMDESRFCANAIQNSVRELNLLEDLRAGRPARSNYLYGFGTLQEGHTGSTFEGLWVAGVVAALKTETQPVYGADADHITVRRGPGGVERAKRVIDAARDYTFFTLDVSDVVDYAATADARGLVDKYATALGVVEELAAHLGRRKGDTPFDLELSIDECPPQRDAALCLTTEAELAFLIEELRGRGVAVTHIAPNVGIVKGQDYEGADGLAGFEARVRRLQEIAAGQGIMLDFHSGDDLGRAARQAIGRATNGRCHFKVSPALQVIFGQVLHEFDPQRFRLWWEDTLAYARREAAAGSEFAARCLREHESGNDPTPAPHYAVFHHYNFASVGRRDENGQFVHRKRFYDLPAEFYEQYHERIRRFLCDVAEDVFRRRPVCE